MKSVASGTHCFPDQFNTNELHVFITHTFPGALLLEEHQVHISFPGNCQCPMLDLNPLCVHGSLHVCTYEK